jgi:hypothetical protein
MSPLSFHRYVWDTGLQDFGLDYHQFPLSQLVALDWTDDTSRKKWKKWASKASNKLDYQMWKTRPWPDVKPGNHLSRLLGSSNRWKPPKPSHRRIYYTTYDKCRPVGMVVPWDLDFWTGLRMREIQCLRRSEHLRNNTECGLKPWPQIQSLRETLDRQILFWKTALMLRNSRPDFVSGLKLAINDYHSFMVLLRPPKEPSGIDPENAVVSNPSKGAHPHNQSGGDKPARLVPPTIEVDLLWHSHRLFPGSYWYWSCQNAWRLVECDGIVEKPDAAYHHKETLREWEAKYRRPLAGANTVTSLIGHYIPGLARPVTENAGRDKQIFVLSGKSPIRGRLSGPMKPVQFITGGLPGGGISGGYGGFGDSGGGGGGCGGGDGGCGG